MPLPDPPEAGGFELISLQYFEPPLRALWEEHREGILASWTVEHPGTRPSCWWRWDSPRCAPGMLAGRAVDHARGPAPRQRLGGVGTPVFEVLNYVPAFEIGVPVQWVSRWDADYYNGRARGVHGAPIGTQYREGNFAGVAPDPRDPPRFESQAAYLDRHGLLLPSERRRLTDADFAPEIVEINEAAG